jgi:hypothetical protein
MNMRTGLFGLGLLVVAGSLTISCGGSDDGGDDNSKAGTSNTSSGSSSGGSGTSGSATTAGTTSDGGTTSNGGSNSAAGTTSDGGTTSNGGTNTGDGGDDPGPFPGAGGDGPFPGAGGDGGFDLDACDAAVMDGGACEQGDQACENAAGDTCFCSGQGGGDREWNCIGFGGGEGGGGPGGFGAECPDNAADGDECEGFGACTGQAGCSCQQGEVNCQ